MGLSTHNPTTQDSYSLYDYNLHFSNKISGPTSYILKKRKTNTKFLKDTDQWALPQQSEDTTARWQWSPLGMGTGLLEEHGIVLSFNRW
jgi:hypothetical protein